MLARSPGRVTIRATKPARTTEIDHDQARCPHNHPPLSWWPGSRAPCLPPLAAAGGILCGCRGDHCRSAVVLASRCSPPDVTSPRLWAIPFAAVGSNRSPPWTILCWPRAWCSNRTASGMYLLTIDWCLLQTSAYDLLQNRIAVAHGCSRKPCFRPYRSSAQRADRRHSSAASPEHTWPPRPATWIWSS